MLSRLTAGESLIGAGPGSLKLLLEGEEIYVLDGRSYRLTPGMLLFIDAGADCRMVVPRGVTSTGMCVYLPPDGPPLQSPGDSEGLGRAVLRFQADKLFRPLVSQAAGLHASSPDCDAGAVLRRTRAALASALGEARLHFERIGAKKASTRRDILARLEVARSFLHAERSRAVSLTELAKVAGLSPFHLTRCFTAVFGVAPAQYHRSLLLKDAQAMLRAGGMSATQVAEAVGYLELSTFTRAFRREFGHPPSVYLSRH